MDSKIESKPGGVGAVVDDAAARVAGECCAPCNAPLQQVVQRDVAPDAPEPGPELAGLLAAAGLSAEGLWPQVLDSMHEGLLLVGPDRRVLYLNKRAEQLIGRPLAEVRGVACTEAINCPQCKCFCRLFEDGGAEAVEVTVFSHADSSRRVLRKNARLLGDAQGRVLGGVETFVDITREIAQRKEAERFSAMLVQEKTRVEALLGAMEEGVFAVDGSLRVVSASARLAELLGLPDAGSILGRPLREVFAVAPDFFGAGQAADLEGRRFELCLPRGCERQAASLSFRRVRVSDDEMLGLLRLSEERPRVARAAVRADRFHGILSRSPQMWEIFRLMECAAQSDANILIEGESGVGKELVARAIHQLSPRSDDPFYGVNCATFSGSLLLSELFGHERGSFTGAFKTTPGKLELAGNGTLFLDEVSEIPLHYQALLLRVLEERNFERVGGRKRIELGARVVAATNRRLSEQVQAGQFRQDLFFRLRVIPIRVPPLRERPEDVPLLANHFAAVPARNFGAKAVRFSDAALEAMSRYGWPGNVRELRNTVEYLCFVSSGTVELEHLPPEIRGEPGAPGPARPLAATVGPVVTGPRPGQAMMPGLGSAGAGGLAGAEEAERAAVLDALQRARFRRSEAAELLGIDRTTLWRKMKRLGI